MEDATPPTEHFLRPHHVALLTILYAAFNEDAFKNFPPPFLLFLYRLLLSEVSEVAQPKSYQELIQELAAAPMADAEQCRVFIRKVNSMCDEFQSAERLAHFFGKTYLFLDSDKSDEGLQAIFERRSIFGYFCRRCFMSFLKLSFTGVAKLQKDYMAWVKGDSRAGYQFVDKDNLKNADLLIFKTQADKKVWAKPNAYEAWEKGLAVGDENLAAENLRRFFEQHFHENNDSGLRQHALLNLVRMHYINQEYPAARKLLSEAITVARTSSDRVTLQHCLSLLHRLPPESPQQKYALNEIQPDIHPLEILFDVKKLLDEQSEQPLSISFTRIFEAMSLYDHWLDAQLAVPHEEGQWSQHAVQSIVWSAAGCDRLADIEENMIFAFTYPGGEDSNRLTMTLNRAYKNARQGRYEESLAMLVDPSTWRGLALHEYTSWANEIWQICTLRATRRGQHRLYREFLLPRRPPGAFNSKEYVFDHSGPPLTRIRETLYKVLEMRQQNQATSAIEYLLQALWHSEFLGRMHEYRTGIILLADVGLEFGMSKMCRRILDEILPQIIKGNDREQRAVACFTMARCIIVAEKSTELATALREALPYLLTAKSDFSKLEMYSSLTDVEYMLSVVYHNLGLLDERDEAAKRHSTAETTRKKLETVIVDKEIVAVLDLVAEVGAALASR